MQIMLYLRWNQQGWLSKHVPSPRLIDQLIPQHMLHVLKLSSQVRPKLTPSLQQAFGGRGGVVQGLECRTGVVCPVITGPIALHAVAAQREPVCCYPGVTSVVITGSRKCSSGKLCHFYHPVGCTYMELKMHSSISINSIFKNKLMTKQNIHKKTNKNQLVSGT
jgi:hypothetical protein